MFSGNKSEKEAKKQRNKRKGTNKDVKETHAFVFNMFELGQGCQVDINISQFFCNSKWHIINLGYNFEMKIVLPHVRKTISCFIKKC